MISPLRLIKSRSGSPQVLVLSRVPQQPGVARVRGGAWRHAVVPISPSYRASTRLSPPLIIGVTGLATGTALAICPPLLTVLLATCASLLTPLHPLRLRLGN